MLDLLEYLVGSYYEDLRLVEDAIEDEMASPGDGETWGEKAQFSTGALDALDHVLTGYLTDMERTGMARRFSHQVERAKKLLARTKGE